MSKKEGVYRLKNFVFGIYVLLFIAGVLIGRSNYNRKLRNAYEVIKSQQDSSLKQIDN